MHVDYNSKLGEYSRNIDKERQQNKDILIELEANRAREDLDGLSLDDLHNQPAVHFQYFKPSDERAIASASSPQQATAAPTSPPSASPSASTAPATPAPVESDRKIIRHGEMQFEVDSFDSAFLQNLKKSLPRNADSSIAPIRRSWRTARLAAPSSCASRRNIWIRWS